MHQHALEQFEMEHLVYHKLAFLDKAQHTDHQAYQDYLSKHNSNLEAQLQIQ